MQKGFAPILLLVGIIVIALIGGGVYYLGTKNTSTPAQNQIAATPTPSHLKEPASNWKTYTNTQYGYSIKYPANANFSEETFTQSQFYGKSLGAIHIGIPAKNPNKESPTSKIVNVYIWNSSTDQPLYSAAMKHGKYIDIGNYKALYDVPLREAGPEQKIYYIQGPNKFYEISQDDLLPLEESSIFDQILSTFKFLDSNEDEVLNLPKDQCPCWDGGKNICYPQSACQ
jgi:hypothetical protein